MKSISLWVFLFWICETAAQTLFPTFPQNGFLFPWLQPEGQLPAVTRKGRSPNQKLKACCRQLPQADAECKARFCDFDAIRSDMVNLTFYREIDEKFFSLNLLFTKENR